MLLKNTSKFIVTQEFHTMTKINSDARVAEAFKYFATKKTSKEFT